MDELKRIQSIRDKKKQEMKGSDLMTSMLVALSERNAALGLGLDTSSDTSRSSSKYSNEESSGDFFTEVMKVKRKVPFNSLGTKFLLETEELIERSGTQRRTRPKAPSSSRLDLRIRSPTGLEKVKSQESLELPPVSRSPRLRIGSDL